MLSESKSARIPRSADTSHLSKLLAQRRAQAPPNQYRRSRTDYVSHSAHMPLQNSSRTIIGLAYLLGLCLLAACREQPFYCESVGHIVGTADLSKDAARRCYKLKDICERSAPSCFTQPDAHCLRTYSSDRYTFDCAPSLGECQSLHKQREDASFHVESCQLKRPEHVD
jgi:hypothetical protein